MPEVGEVVGTMTIEAVESGALTPWPRVSFSPVGKITSGWLDKHSLLLQREADKAHAANRLGVSSVAPESAVASPRRRGRA